MTAHHQEAGVGRAAAEVLGVRAMATPRVSECAVPMLGLGFDAPCNLYHIHL